MDSTAIRHKLYDYIRLEDEIVENEWWKDKQFVEELDSRLRDL